MPVRAVIFDLYGTLLEVLPPAAGAEARWAELWAAHLGGAPRLELAGFRAACRRAVEDDHAGARARGIAYPEVFWPRIVETVLPELAALPPERRRELPFYEAGFLHTVRLQPGAAEALRTAAAAGPVLGLASNCQPYTRRELAAALAPAGLAPGLFAPELTFLSFEHGFSKPDPHVFRLLTSRLALLGIAPEEALMVGDRLDNDLLPARAQGWRTLAVGTDAREAWRELHHLLARPPGPRP